MTAPTKQGTPSETPLTDAQWQRHYHEDFGLGDKDSRYVVDIEFAKQMERDRASLITMLELVLQLAEPHWAEPSEGQTVDDAMNLLRTLTAPLTGRGE